MKALQLTYDFLTGNLKNTVSENLLKYRKLPEQVRQKQDQIKNYGTREIQARFSNLKSTPTNSSDTFSCEVFALAAEVFQREMQIQLYDEQIVAAKAMSEMNIIEMQTGEGKTMVAVLTACLLAVQEKRVHIFTFNDYLAERDAQWMQRIYQCLGLEVSFVINSMSDAERKVAYQADVVYTTAKSVGFDYLRSSMAYSSDDYLLPPFEAVIVDEADAILIDEARNPLVFAGESERETPDLYKVAVFCHTLKEEEHYLTDEYSRNVYLTDMGVMMAEGYFDVEGLHDLQNSDLLTAINLGLQAKVLLIRDVDYIVDQDRIMLVD
ncbi:MAG: DEAD/DEAH box helicase, partial [Cyclobacteriaceae bacterium]